MIAQLQYAIDYRPYILDVNKNKKVDKATRVGKPTENTGDKEAVNSVKSAPQLLKANNENVVNYMRTLASSVNDMKFSVKTLNRSITRFNSNYYDDDELVKEFIDEDIDEFVKALNSSFKGTLTTDMASENLSKYLGTVQESLASNIDLLDDLGIEISGGEAHKVDSLVNLDNIKSKSKRFTNMLGQINDATNEMLGKSIYEQVKFNSMKNFVNYSFNSSTEKTFELFTEGLVLDIAI